MSGPVLTILAVVTRARGARFRRALTQTDLLEPPGRRCGCWSTSLFRFSGLLLVWFGATMEFGRSAPAALDSNQLRGHLQQIGNSAALTVTAPSACCQFSVFFIRWRWRPSAAPDQAHPIAAAGDRRRRFLFTELRSGGAGGGDGAGAGRAPIDTAGPLAQRRQGIAALTSLLTLTRTRARRI
jgi:hypothetical protein